MYIKIKLNATTIDIGEISAGLLMWDIINGVPLLFLTYN
jgi:hypothetical protein